MQFIPVNRPVAMEKKDETEINSVFTTRTVRKTGANAVEEITPETHPAKSPPLPGKPPPRPLRDLEHDFHERKEEERRKYCRRIQNGKMPFDLRGKGDRRKKNQRSGDVTTAIDETA